MALKRYERGEGKDWNVKETIAFGKGDVHKEFQGLQADLNNYASRFGFEKLDVDGFLGPKSVTAFEKIYAAVIKKNPALAATPFPVPKTKEDVAEYAQFIRQWLQTVAKDALSQAEA
jgi:hypothetical protein